MRYGREVVRMTRPQTREEVKEEVEILHTGCWYIAELDNPQLAVQSASEADARQKLVKRWEEFTQDSGRKLALQDEYKHKGL